MRIIAARFDDPPPRSSKNLKTVVFPMNMNRTLKRLSSALLTITLLASWGASYATVALADENGGADADAVRLLDWEVTGPLGGDVRSLAIDPRNAQRIYFGTIDG